MTIATASTTVRLTSEDTSMETTYARLVPHTTVSHPTTLGDALRVAAPIPPSAIFIGLAGDGLPVLLDLHDPSPSPVLIASDSAGGKTRLLRVIASAVDRLQDPDRVRYTVITDAPSEWSTCEQSLNCEGILSFHHALTTGYVASIAHSAQVGRASAPHLLLLIDDLRSLIGDGDIGESMRWLLRQGCAHGIWSFVTLNTSGPGIPRSVLEPFRVRLLGPISDGFVSASLAGAPSEAIPHLRAGLEFAMRERDSWIPFLIPSLE